jgi:tetratricopeptide (TPR) repeat protein
MLLAICMACGAPGQQDRVLILALDGLDPEIVNLLVSEGQLPHFQRLAEQGASGRLESREPLLSPIIWTTIATGRTADVHGIGDFIAVNERTGQSVPATSRMRKVRALWNIFSEAERSVAVVGWWATWPAEEVNGHLVSDHLCYHFTFRKGLEGDEEALALTWPPDLAPRIAGLVKRPADISPADASRFVDVEAEAYREDFTYQDELAHFRWVLATANTYRDVGLRLWQDQHPDLAMVYIEGVDSTSHLFGHLFRGENLKGELAEQALLYGRAAEEMYRYADEILGRYMAAMDEHTTLIVLSDHGFKLGELPTDPSMTRDMRRVRANQHRLHGYIGLLGRNVRPGTAPKNATILDMAPTILALAGLPAAKNMPGRVLMEVLDLPELPRISSYEEGDSVADQVEGDPGVDDQILERLRSLGYLDTTAPRSEKVLAGVMFEEGRLNEALSAYRELLEENPADGALLASIGAVLGEMGRFDEAEEYLDRAVEITPLNVSAYHNRGVIQEKRGEPEAAIASYRTALRYRPEFRPSRDALVRLVGSAALPLPDDPRHRQADELATQAAALARQGDYKAASELLDQAMSVAPDYALLYQYRSNVDYLLGDREGAMRALRRGMELDPDNALFRQNLRNLDAMPDAGVDREDDHEIPLPAQ